MFKIIEFLMCAGLYVRVGILFTCGKHFHDRIISLRGEVWAPPLFFLLNCQYQVRKVSDRVSLCQGCRFLRYSIVFGTVPTVFFCCCFFSPFYCNTQLFLLTILTKSSAVIVLIDNNLDFKSSSDICPSSICLAYT